MKEKIRVTGTPNEVHIESKKPPLEERLAQKVDQIAALDDGFAELEQARTQRWRIEKQLGVVSGQATAIGILVMYIALRLTFCG